MAKAQPLYHPMRPRVRSRKRERMRAVRTVFKWIGTVIVVCALAYAFLNYLTRSPRFSVWEVSINGLEQIQRDEVIAAAGLDSPLNLMAMQPEQVARELEAKLAVKSCTVRREFPNRLFITVEERHPYALLMLRSHAYQLDAEGVVIRELGPLENLEQPMISGPPEFTLPVPGDVVDAPEMLLALQLLDEWLKSPLHERWTLSEIAARSPGEIAMYFEDLPFELRWGRSPIPSQMQRLETLVAQEGELYCAEYLDLRFGPDLVCR